jgi:tRNA threonylcarbamoyladenosine biosynthesis protein TsaB
MILALQTADATTRIWLIELYAKAGEPAETWESGRQLADGLLQHISGLLAQRKHEFKDITGIIVFSGPGSFTSLRIGHTVANALADSLDIPVLGQQGDDWLAAGLRDIAATPKHQPALPYYGSEANITKPRG